jgi:PAS domain S-box-containing protein
MYPKWHSSETTRCMKRSGHIDCHLALGSPQRRDAVTADPEADLSRQWVETWRGAVRASPSAVGLVQLPSTRFLELSRSAAELLGTTPADGIGTEYLALVERPYESALTAWLVTTRAAEAVHVQRRLRRADGSVIDVAACCRAIRSGRGADMALWVPCDVATRAGSAQCKGAMAGARAGVRDPDLKRGSPPVVALDGDWRVAGLNRGVDEALGYRTTELVGKALTQLVNPEDLALLLLALARATSGMNASETLRLRQRDGTWRGVAVTPTALDDGGVPRFSLVLTGADAPPSPGSRGASILKHHLSRIATELDAAGAILTATEAFDVAETPALLDLSSRQQEIVYRLLRGERVPRIANALYLSQSTVRNHLAAIFRKFGVHSQEELLAELRDAPLVDPPARR